MKKRLALVTAVVVLLSGCGFHTFEADPIGGDRKSNDHDCFIVRRVRETAPDDTLGRFCRDVPDTSS